MKDGSTKAPSAERPSRSVAALAVAAAVGVVAFGGHVDAAAEIVLAAHGVIVVPIVDGPLTLEDAHARPEELLERAARRIATLVLTP